MGRCEYCKKDYFEWKHLSFYTFPKEEHMKLKWVENMGRKNWMPKEGSVLCSEHFTTDSIDFYEKKARLRQDSIPTIFNGNIDHIDSNKENKILLLNNEGRRNELLVHEGNIELSGHAEAMVENAAYFNIDQSSSTSPTLEVEECVKNVSHENALLNTLRANAHFKKAIIHDHFYTHLPNILQQKLHNTRKRLKQVLNEKRVLQQKVKRMSMTVKSMRNVLRHLQDSRRICKTDELQL